MAKARSKQSVQKDNDKTKGDTEISVSNTSTDLIKLRREIGLLEGTAITIGSIIGSGIFVSPKGVVALVGSVGTSILVWISCGIISTAGALCYAELGTTYQGSGGEYYYLYKAFGPVPAFCFLWITNIIFLPTTNAILALTFAKYVTQPFFPLGCEIPTFALRLIAACAILFLTFLNCFDVRKTTQLQNAFMFGKISALAVIIAAGIYTLSTGHTENYMNPWEGSELDPGKIATGFYSGIFAYNGWNTLNYMTEELKEPTRNLPRVIYISMPVVTTIYVLANVAYFSALSPAEMIASDAVAVSFGQKVLGSLALLMPVCVAMSAFGGLSVHIMTSSRMMFVGARNGHFPSMLSLIKTSRLTPTPSLIFLGMLSLIYLCTSDIYALINLSTFVQSVVSFTTIVALLYLRRKEPDVPRPLRVSNIFPMFFLLICLFLCVLPVYVRPWEVLIATAICLSAIPIYFLFIFPKSKPKKLEKAIEVSTTLIQKVLLSLPEEMSND